MLSSLTERHATFVTERWRGVLLGWLIVTSFLVAVAPRWKDIAYDGDFEYLPPDMNTVAAARVLDEAFPGDRARSQIVLILARRDHPLDDNDLIVGDDLLRRLHHRLSEVCWQRAIDLGYDGGPIEQAPPDAKPWLDRAVEALDQSIAVDERFYQAFADHVPDKPPTLTEPRMAIAYFDRAKLLEQLGNHEREVGDDYQDALILVPEIESIVPPIEQRNLSAWKPMLDLLSWDDSVIGGRLSKPGARLAVLQLSSELAATSNIDTIEAVQRLLADVRDYSSARIESTSEQNGLQLAMTGSAAIGGETLIAARDAIRYTELITVLMILVILALVYRAPLLVAVPMLSIGIAVAVSTALVGLLTDWSIRDVVPGLNLRVFTTSRIFIVVILFGAGTDYCLFLISRLREEAAGAEWPLACKRAVSGVTGALLGSALTTIFGLAMLWFAQFGKYHYTGPVVAICLFIGLAVCLTLTPALLRALGPKVFWPAVVAPREADPAALISFPTRVEGHGAAAGGGIWDWIAIRLTRRPAATCLTGLILLLIPGIYGWRNEDSTTYDMSSQLDTQADSRRGFRILAEHFNIGEINPVTVLLVRAEGEPRESLKKQIKTLSDHLYELPGVVAVRTSNDPLGDFPPDREMSLLSTDAWRRRALQQHRVAQNYFFSSNPEYQDRLVRLDLVVKGDPFSLDTAERVSNIGRNLGDLSRTPESDWYEADVYLAGTTPSIIDLRSVTTQDNQRIKTAVVIAVFLVLVAVIRRVGLCLYLILTVLLSYYATLGLTILFFQGVYGDEYVGLDWKLPLFLFVILVAVGQDYNVYLVTRIIEEQRHRGWLAALRHAVSRTGGIITACGLVMVATFLSMTSSAWMPGILSLLGFENQATTGLRGIIELGFAMGLGVLIDTFYVRTILVPSFVALMGRLGARVKRAESEAT
ncbi:MMPL family transporter [Roseiconus nitratireducens]|uniref:MMPL family transporter n=1 Tax=Roseiconus nitratireducens TaxID=2605748 RepID=A0A5M6DDT0_9BACT|nr:MMPL family transporter [Roseiconus nitratireducens]KAA5545553.1 MMPL family transporter [Roseiconus nitratireducens]